jgi:hypothetical protein
MPQEYRDCMGIRAFGMLVCTVLVAQPLMAERTPFEICAESTTWTRPTPEVQAKIWNDGRYKDFARTAYAWTHNFLVVLDPESTNEFGYLSNLSRRVRPCNSQPVCSFVATLRGTIAQVGELP